MKNLGLIAAGLVLLAAPALAQEFRLGDSWAQREDRGAACSRATELAWRDAEATRVSSCNCHKVYEGSAEGYRCTVTAFAAELRAPTPQNSYGNIYNNPYGGTTTVLPGVR